MFAIDPWLYCMLFHKLNILELENCEKLWLLSSQNAVNFCEMNINLSFAISAVFIFCETQGCVWKLVYSQ